MTIRRFLLGGCLPLLAIAACGASTPRPPTDPSTAIVRVDYSAALSPPSERYSLPTVSVFGDGTAVLSAEDQGLMYSGVRRTLTAEQLRQLFERAAGADLFDDHDYRRDDVLDGNFLGVTVRSTRGTFETSVAQPSDKDRGHRGRVVRFAESAMRAGAEAGEFRPARYAAVVVADAEETGDVRPWPLPMPLERMSGFSNRPCEMLDSGSPVLTAARAATRDTRWQAGDQRVKLMFRPLLPDETDCAAIR